MLNIKYIPLPQNDVAYKKTSYSMQPEFVVIHNTANNASAENEINYMHISNDYRSFHYAVDDKSIVQGLPLNKNGWHSGDDTNGNGNRKGIGIEICYSLSDSNKAKFEKAQENAAELTAYLLKKYGWGNDRTRVKKHQDFDGKYCPHRTLSDYGWEYFLNLVEQKYKEMYGGENEPMTAEEKKAFDALKSEVTRLKETVAKYEKQEVYENAAIRWNYVDKNLPTWATPTIKKLIQKGYLKGNGKNELELSYVMMRILVILDRAKIFGE